MATFLVHAALPIVAKRAFRVRDGLDRRVLVASVIAACAPDLDVATLALEVPESSPWSHRGVAHSLALAAVFALAAGLVAFRRLDVGSREWFRVVAFVAGAGASHGIVDAMTAAESGVALFAPFSDARVLFPWKLLPSPKLGLEEYLGFWGVLTIANELLFAIVPVMIVVAFLRGEVDKNLLRIRAVFWLVCAAALRLMLPEWFAPTVGRPLRAVGSIDDGDLKAIPADDLPGKEVLVRLDDLAKLFDKDLEPAARPWSSSFFPSWLGSDSGRWSEGRPRLVWRTLFGFRPPSEREAKSWASAAAAGDPAARDRLFTLAPVEKVDLVLGRYDFPATTESLTHSHNGHPRYWHGRCNGVATASLFAAEPSRVVDVIGVDGTRVQFHPNDVKALLAVAYFDAPAERAIGSTCKVIGFDPGATCSMNPATLVVALVNRLGIAKQSFLVDVHATIAKQYYAVAGARVHVVRDRHPIGGTPIDAALAPRASALVDVEIELTLSSTKLPYAPADQRIDDTRYRKVGVVPVVRRYEATLVIDRDSALIGGRWRGDPPDGPDTILLASPEPSLREGDRLVAAERIPWSLVRELARASADDMDPRPTIDVRTLAAQ